jgi:phthalate 4,5-cis-dihydrodiol dehydrogenase
MATDTETLNVGIVGAGMAGLGIVPAIDGMPNAQVVAGADTNPRALAALNERAKTQIRAYESIEELCNDKEVDAVWIATPNVFHCPHTIFAAEHGKHVIIEKPMAITIADAEKMIEATEKAGVQLICGGSRSASQQVRKMREIVRSGELGPLRAMSSWSSTAWMLQPRRPDELDVKYGGGVAYRQSPHQVDSVRLLAGGMARSVRAITGQWMAPRDTAPGYFTALIEFEDGTPATLIYSGHGYLMGAELFEPDAAGPNAVGAEDRYLLRKEIRGGTRDEIAAKEARAQGGGEIRPGGQAAPRRGSGFLSDLGLLHVSCEHGEMRQSPKGLYIYSDEGNGEIELNEAPRSSSPELGELLGALNEGRPVLHGGRWGLATLEVSLAIMQSSNEHREIKLERQVPVPEGY